MGEKSPGKRAGAEGDSTTRKTPRRRSAETALGPEGSANPEKRPPGALGPEGGADPERRPSNRCFQH